MANQWYVTIEGDQKGPLTDTEVQRWVQDGRINRDTFVRIGAEGEWQPANDFDGLWLDKTAAMLKELSASEEPQESEEVAEALPADDDDIPAIQTSFAPARTTPVGRTATYRTRRSTPPSLPFSSQTVVKLLVSGVLIAIGIGFVAYAFNMKEGFDRKDDRTRRAQEATERLEESLFRLGIESSNDTPTFEKADRTPFYVCVTIGCVFIGLGLLPLALLGGKAFT